MKTDLPWTPPAFTPGVTWQDRPSTNTPLDAQNLNLEENAEALYATQVGTSVISYVASGSTQVDPFSRISGISSPVPSVMDAPWNALGDGVTVDTTAVQNAMNAVSAVGTSRGNAIPLLFPPGRAFVLGRLTPMPYVDIRAHGSLFKRDPAFTQDIPIFYHFPGIGFGTAGDTGFALRGAKLVGTGSETPFQGLILYGQGNYVTVEDCTIKNCAGLGIYIADSQYVWVERNRLDNVGTLENSIDLVSGQYGNTSPLKYVWCNRNVVVNCPALGIALVSSYSNRTDPIIDAHLTDNTCITSGSSVGWPMAIEQGGTTGPPNISTVDISGNTLVQMNSTARYALALTIDGSPLSSDPLCISDVTVSHNRLISQQATGIGMICCGSHIAITGNKIKAATDDVLLAGINGAVIHHHTITGNVGHEGTGKGVNIFGAASVDLTTLTSSNTP